MSTAAKFDKAVKIVQGLPKDGPVQTSQDDKLKFYGLYKQATEGDVKSARPGMMDFTGKAKWDAYKANEGMSQEEAKEKYVELLLSVLGRVESEESAAWITEINSA